MGNAFLTFKNDFDEYLRDEGKSKVVYATYENYVCIEVLVVTTNSMYNKNIRRLNKKIIDIRESV